ncbi:MAG: MerR family transcriptional regulator [Actinomycetota bacterium]|nr:MerR family transcriptional regulator [Actinomycetota bacterium]
MQERPYLSIGEVLGLLLEEFPDVTISKIRFLESQGLIDPERTASGYRKFYDNDVDLLRVILREQRENFLPLRVIRDRLESGAIEDPTGPTTPPRGIHDVQVLDESDSDDDHDDDLDRVAANTPVNAQRHPARQHAVAPVSSASADHRHDSFAAGDLCQLAGLTGPQLAELESYGLLAGKGSGSSTLYTAADLAIAQAASGFMQRGVEGRHLRAWRQAAEREASLFEQMILPLLRQRNPQARQEAVLTLTALAALGGELRSAIVRSALSHHLDG